MQQEESDVDHGPVDMIDLIDWLIDWLIVLWFTPYQQYSSHVPAEHVMITLLKW